MEERRDHPEPGTAERIRRWGYLAGAYDPLDRIATLDPRVPLTTDPAAERLRSVYMGPLAVEFMHLPFEDRRRWIAERMEAPAPEVDPEALLKLLVRAEVFEQVLQSHYAGTKRFSLEGMTSLIPLLHEMLRGAASLGAVQIILGMSHRGRLNVMTHVLGIPPRDIFARFEDAAPESVMGSGDVKYHLGAVGTFDVGGGRTLDLSLLANPSHLEAVDPVVLGTARALQDRRGEKGPQEICPILLHGDAAIAGQGLAAETFNLAGLPGYTVGGTVHLVLNNMIGFTTLPKLLYSSAAATDVARRIPIPIFHVNAEAPEAVVRAARMAVEYRYAFGSDVVLDLVGYRRHGHSEVDDPTTTQPRLYRRIAERAPLWRSYGAAIGKENAELDALADRTRRGLDRELDTARSMTSVRPLDRPSASWSEFTGGPYDPGAEVITAVDAETLAALGRRLTELPPGFHAHPKVAAGLAVRREMAEGRRPIDWACAEALGFATLLAEGVGVRLSGQDTRRGTFNQRHAVLVDVDTDAELVPLNRLSPDQAAFLDVVDSPLSEAVPLGFEYGYSRANPERLVLWEAQFGDFANGAQILIDQFLCAAEEKWGHLSGLTLLLPHGFEGQGPEHSHARPERFLQIAARDSLQVCQPSTAAQYFHLLRRQALRRWRKPLIVLTPKAMLRHPAAASPREALTDGEFERVRIAAGAADAARVLVASGKLLHELQPELERHPEVALVAVEELYPFPAEELAAALASFPAAREARWVQEEPANMGARDYILPQLRRIAGDRSWAAVSRAASGSPATGSAAVHRQEQAEILRRALEGPDDL